jgi:hypothetical protein
MLLSGCGGDAKAAGPAGPTLAPALQGDPTAVVDAAAGHTVTSGNAGISLSVPLMAEKGLTNVTGEGAIDFPGHKVKLVVPNAAQNEERQFGRSLYVLLPEQAGGALGGKQWVKVDLATTSAKSPDPLSLYAFDPQQLLTTGTAIEGASLVGHEDIRGTATTHFTGTLDPAKAAQAGVDPTFAKQLRATTNGTPVPADVWLDDSGLIRRMTLGLRPPTAKLAPDAHPATTIELFDFGTADVSFPEPPAGQVAGIDDLTTLGGSGD